MTYNVGGNWGEVKYGRTNLSMVKSEFVPCAVYSDTVYLCMYKCKIAVRLSVLSPGGGELYIYYKLLFLDLNDYIEESMK